MSKRGRATIKVRFHLSSANGHPPSPSLQYAFEGAAQLIVISRDLCLSLDWSRGGGGGEVLDGVKDRTWRGRRRRENRGKTVITRKGHTEKEREQLERGESSESEDKFSSGLQMHVKVW